MDEEKSPPPIVQLDPDAAGHAPILSYNVPDNTSYAGRNLIRLVFVGDDPFLVGEPILVSDLLGGT